MENNPAEQPTQPVQPVTPTPVQVPPPVEPEKQNFLKARWLKIGIGVVFLLILLGGVYLLGKNNVTKTQTPAVVKSTPIPTEETAKWKTYEGSGYSFKYPSNSKITSEKAYSFMTSQNPTITKITGRSSDDTYTVEIYAEDNQKNLSPKELIDAYLEKLSQPSGNTTSEITGNKMMNDGAISKITHSLKEYKNGEISGLHALFGSDYDYDVIVMTKDNKIYTFLYNGDQGGKISNDAEKIVNQILSTFKFTDSTSSEKTANDYPSFLENVKAAVTTGNTQPLVIMQKTAQATCNSEGFHVSNMCDGLPDGSKITGYQLGYWQSEGTILSEADFANNITKYISEQGPFRYFGEASNEKKAVVVFTNPSKSTLLIFYAQKETTGWKTVVAIEGSSQGFDMNQVTLDFQDY